MGRSPCCAKEGLTRGAWTALEDKVLTDYIKLHGEGNWRNLPKKAGLKRCGKSCRLRWLNYLRPDIKRGNINRDEEELIIRLHKLLGNRWSLIAGRLPGRTDNEIKNYWNTNLVKRVKDQRHHQNSAPNHNKQTTNHNSSDKSEKKPSVEPSTTKTRPLSPPILEPHVVRTKAMRCTNEVLNSVQHQKLDHFNAAHYESLPPNSMPRDASVDDLVGYYGSYRDEISTFTSGRDNVPLAPDFMLDFNIGDLNGLSNLLNSDFSDLCGFNYSDDNNCNELSPNTLLQPLIFYNEMVGDWTGSNQGGHSSSNATPSLTSNERDCNWLRE